MSSNVAIIERRYIMLSQFGQPSVSGDGSAKATFIISLEYANPHSTYRRLLARTADQAPRACISWTQMPLRLLQSDELHRTRDKKASVASHSIPSGTSTRSWRKSILSGKSTETLTIFHTTEVEMTMLIISATEVLMKSAITSSTNCDKALAEEEDTKLLTSKWENFLKCCRMTDYDDNQLKIQLFQKTFNKCFAIINQIHSKSLSRTVALSDLPVGNTCRILKFFQLFQTSSFHGKPWTSKIFTSQNEIQSARINKFKKDN